MAGKRNKPGYSFLDSSAPNEDVYDPACCACNSGGEWRKMAECRRLRLRQDNGVQGNFCPPPERNEATVSQGNGHGTCMGCMVLELSISEPKPAPGYVSVLKVHKKAGATRGPWPGGLARL